ncbi:MAG: GGDEF domain-containing protein [Xanthomonadales bacterium]|nr:GGDEF domain-containing protein [Xanthomonadales bacterium]
MSRPRSPVVGLESRHGTLRRLRQRLAEDFRLAVILLCGGCTIAGILPFLVTRALRGEWLVVALDVLVILAIASANVYAWVRGRTRGPGAFLVLVNNAGALSLTLMAGIAGVLWTFPVLLMNFFLVDRLPALFASIALVALVAAQPTLFADPMHAASYAVTAALVGLYAFIFAFRAARQHGHLEGLARRDPMTGAGNRRQMEADLAAAVARFELTRPGMAVALLDLDHFKGINDRYGHEAGDRVIVSFVDRVRECVRGRDRLYRFGGEEFVLLLENVDAAGAFAALDKVRRHVGMTLHAPGGPVTVSIGAAVLREDEPWQPWLARADAALYAAKRGGRNRVVLAGTMEPSASAANEPASDPRLRLVT